MPDAITLPTYSDLIGKPFKLGGRGPDSFDCYGLVQEVYKRANTTIPDYLRPEHLAAAHEVVEHGVREWEAVPQMVGSVAVIRIVGRAAAHVGIVLPYSQMLHVWERSGGVCREPLSSWERRIVGFYRYIK